MKLYSELAEYYYDIEKPGRNFSSEIAFIHEIFQKYHIKTILDVGCGTGEHVNALQSLGYQIEGMDSSEKMIQIAQKRFSKCSFRHDSIQNFNKTSPYDALVCIFGTFNYLLSEEELQSAVSTFSKMLKPSGIAIIEIWNSFPVLKIQKKPISTVVELKINNKYIQRNRGFRVKETLPVQNAIVEVNYIYYLDKKEISDRHIMRVFSLDVTRNLFEKQHFEILNVYGDYDKKKFHNYCSRILLVVKRK